MTRKQAIARVLDYLRQQPDLDKDLCKAILILKEMQNGIPGKIWSDEAIRESIERFIHENGRPPKVKELGTVEYLPPHPVVTRQYGMTAGKWLDKNYPLSRRDWRRRYEEMSTQDFMNTFISEFSRIDPGSCLDFNRRRKEDTPSWQYTAKMLGVQRWSELKDLCGVHQKSRYVAEPVFHVEAHISGLPILKKQNKEKQ